MADLGIVVPVVLRDDDDRDRATCKFVENGSMPASTCLNMDGGIATDTILHQQMRRHRPLYKGTLVPTGKGSLPHEAELKHT